MAEEIYSVSATIDTESDWGGRTNDIKGIEVGIPIILELLKKYNHKAVFFISTEILPRIMSHVEAIKEAGHFIGSHGHFHIQFRDRFRAEQDRVIATEILRVVKPENQKFIPYRAPKFSYVPRFEPYADPKNHLGLLKYTWFPQVLREGHILYIHPFDIVGGNNPPNLFCKAWYSRPKKALENLEKLLAYLPNKRTQHA